MDKKAKAGRPLEKALPSIASTPWAPERILDSRWDGRSTFTVEEAGCEILGLSKCSAYAAANAGTLPAIRVGRRFVVPRIALEKLLASA